jgi:hypothetical protein
VEFLETPAFTRQLQQYLSDEEFAALQQFLVANPEAGDLMPGTGGFRKLRWVGDQQIWFFTLFAKDEATDLTADQKRQLRTAIETERRIREKARKSQHRR